VGRYEARSNPVADTDPATPLAATFRIVPSEYEFVARGAGFGAKRFTFAFKPAQVRDLPVQMDTNLALSANGATATGDGVNVDKLIDDSEGTNWASLVSPVAGKQVTVRLDPSKSVHQIRRIQVSAALRTRLPADPFDPLTQNRFTALRSFQLLACEAKGAVDCSSADDYKDVFTSPADAFPSIAPRPRIPELIYRSWAIPQTKATDVRLVVLTNQCTGGPAFQG
jgi:extracellular elastinolytic metalloproteinase